MRQIVLSPHRSFLFFGSFNYGKEAQCALIPVRKTPLHRAKPQSHMALLILSPCLPCSKTRPKCQKIIILTATIPVMVREASNHGSFSTAIISSVMVGMSQRWCSPGWSQRLWWQQPLLLFALKWALRATRNLLEPARAAPIEPSGRFHGGASAWGRFRSARFGARIKSLPDIPAASTVADRMPLECPPSGKALRPFQSEENPPELSVHWGFPLSVGYKSWCT